MFQLGGQALLPRLCSLSFAASGGGGGGGGGALLGPDTVRLASFRPPPLHPLVQTLVFLFILPHFLPQHLRPANLSSISLPPPPPPLPHSGWFLF